MNSCDNYKSKLKVLQVNVLVLLAAYNGIPYLPEQLVSILNQLGVTVTVIVSVDVSSDGTEAWFDSLAQKDSQIVVLPHGERFGGAAKNFFRLLRDVDFSNFDYVAFSDQDDIWNNDKLIKQVELIKKHNADGVSSNVMAFWPDGKRRLINKAQSQRELDCLFESAGPGCTFLMTQSLVQKVRDLLADASSPASNVALHDWLCYAVCRAYGGTWHIDPQPTVQYRQHAHNVMGVNSGFKAKINRLRQLRNGWYRAEVLKIAKICQAIRPNDMYVDLIGLLRQRSFINRLRLLAYVPQARRKFSDRCWLALAIILGAF